MGAGQSHNIHKSGGEVFLVEQDTIEYVSPAHLKFILCNCSADGKEFFFEIDFFCLRKH